MCFVLPLNGKDGCYVAFILLTTLHFDVIGFILGFVARAACLAFDADNIYVAGQPLDSGEIFVYKQAVLSMTLDTMCACEDVSWLLHSRSLER